MSRIPYIAPIVIGIKVRQSSRRRWLLLRLFSFFPSMFVVEAMYRDESPQDQLLVEVAPAPEFASIRRPNVKDHLLRTQISHKNTAKTKPHHSPSHLAPFPLFPSSSSPSPIQVANLPALISSSTLCLPHFVPNLPQFTSPNRPNTLQPSQSPKSPKLQLP